MVAAAMIDCFVHHAEVIALKGDNYRLKDRDFGRVPTPIQLKTIDQQARTGVRIRSVKAWPRTSSVEMPEDVVSIV